MLLQKPNGPKLRPPKSSSKSSSVQDEIEIEIAEVLYGMMRQPQGISKQEALANDLLKFDSRDINKSSGDGKSRVSSPISNSQSAQPLSSSLPPQISSTSITPLPAVGGFSEFSKLNRSLLFFFFFYISCLYWLSQKRMGKGRISFFFQSFY